MGGGGTCILCLSVFTSSRLPDFENFMIPVVASGVLSSCVDRWYRCDPQDNDLIAPLELTQANLAKHEKSNRAKADVCEGSASQMDQLP